MQSDKKPKKGGPKDMMKREMAKRDAPYTLDLTKIEGDGSFPCPTCGTKISPEDETEEAYTIVDTKVNNDELVELVISCNNCATQIKLTGFEQTMEGLTN